VIRPAACSTFHGAWQVLTPFPNRWTRHPSRLAREFGRKRFGNEGYAMEALVAELGAAFLCPDLDLVPNVRDDHAAAERIARGRYEEPTLLTLLREIRNADEC
jgi:antirestriction protein ArdC